MFGIGMPEMILILALALIVFGPKKLPELAKSLGRALGEFKRATSDLKDTIQSETGLNDVRQNFKEIDRDLKKSITLADEPSKSDTTSVKEPETKGEPTPPEPLKDAGRQGTEAAAENRQSTKSPGESTESGKSKSQDGAIT